ncbi:methylated-DNA--[protein]-cysteine S-methyltransferase [Dickeya dadantii]|uniref:Methylated-DNA--protein-cysteine methyltransferase n=1 Tax=Dickeya dadantii (strain 3937) TaxID=198628 RepID=E0SCK3_DICD3|nr:methylated-DNA--[protein]-cysteine S-methyltransferase [Dickeya dadantii]ADM98527.1 O-6-alkylguanine-DNA:cysteine-protein methyltransferase [Dickeya dadantii 3937]MCL6407612.1 methylated-DNA--[protein]-cysteine S-methyltransferase [Dickeya dadantii]NAT76014.1 methylated-DNA--[protein]-cysteine S-methyltransferase [Dickeya dadantii]NPE51794.1 methylated-DNA--[protein]-cysteine S-methyltransferase [Dickeya dadantii]NPE53629.1 methylated-DNA--[protein]-cysteine S-methyltransferase [Dickeya dad
MQTFLFDTLPTPIGELLLIADENYHLRAVEWREYEEKLSQSLNKRYRHDPFVLKACNNPGGLTDALRAYFAGDLHIIETLPVAAAGTDFQHQVWQALRTISCGSTTTYGELAARLGQPGAARAVGLANGANPISIVVPCHRVIGAQGALTGYAGGIHRKQWLLTHEGYLPQQNLFNTDH